ncbi:MAG: DUF4384 domain-containing protein [Planctomycetes bacterium]|nr:DUF4384 domain-containing protein [Planctomycetota bacterium]
MKRIHKILKSSLLVLIVIIVTSCAALPILQAVPALVDLAGSAFGFQYAKTVTGIFSLLGNMDGDKKGEPVPEDKLISVEFDIVKQLGTGSSSVMQLKDGDVLTSKDNYKIVFSASRPCYAYIFQIDATTKIDILLPEEGERYDVTKSEPIYAPAGDEWFYLDENKGVEHVYLIASINPILELEDLLKSVRGTSWQMKTKVSVQKPVVINTVTEKSEHGGEAAVKTKDGKVYKLDLSRYQSADKVCLTRWFKHE